MLKECMREYIAFVNRDKVAEKHRVRWEIDRVKIKIEKKRKKLKNE